MQKQLLAHLQELGDGAYNHTCSRQEVVIDWELDSMERGQLLTMISLTGIEGPLRTR